MIEIPPAATCPRAVSMNKWMGAGKKPAPRKHVTDERFRLQINRGRFGTGKKLHYHGFKLGKDEIIICTLYSKIIEVPKNMR